MDFSPLLDTDYAVFGNPATLTPNGGSPLALPSGAVDMTDGAEVNSRGDNALLITIRPVAAVQAADLAALGVTPAQLDGGTITLNVGLPGEETWQIESHELAPMGAGELSGEVRLILLES